MRYDLSDLLKKLTIVLFSLLMPAVAMAAPTEAEVRAAIVAIQAGTDTLAPLIVAQATAQTRFDAAIAILETTRITDAAAEIDTQQLILYDAAAEVSAGTATAATLTAIPAANMALAAAHAIVDPAVARAQTASDNLQDADRALHRATATYEAALAFIANAITAVPAPTDLSAINAQIALLQQQVNALAGADVALAARTSTLEGQAINSAAAWAQLCGRLKVSYTAVCAPFVSAAAAP